MHFRKCGTPPSLCPTLQAGIAILFILPVLGPNGHATTGVPAPVGRKMASTLESSADDPSEPYIFPDDQPIRFTLPIFPQSAAVKNEAGAPWACCVTPYIDVDVEEDEDESGGVQLATVPIDQVARCDQCKAYISHLSDRAPRSSMSRCWKCALCKKSNRFMSHRYRRSSFEMLPELSKQTVEYELPLDSQGVNISNPEALANRGYLAKEPASARPLAYLAVVDETGGPEYHDAMAEILDSCIRSLPDDSLFGVVTVSDRLGLVDLTAPLLHVQFVSLRSWSGADRAPGSDASGGVMNGTAAGAGGALGATLRETWSDAMKTLVVSDVMSLEELLCPLGEDRERISSVVRGLPRICRGESSGQPGGVRAVGQALRLMLNLFLDAGSGRGAMNEGEGMARHANNRTSNGTREGSAVNGMTPPGLQRNRSFRLAGGRIMLFLAGAPNHGPGAISSPATSSAGGGTESGPHAPNEGQTAHLTGAVSPEDLLRGESKAANFYRDQGYRAASRGVSIDVHCFRSRLCDDFGLPSLSPLCKTTGGSMFRHSLLGQPEGNSRPALLAREVCTDLLRPRVYDGLLRIRTSPDVRINRNGVYGSLNVDPRLEGLWHVPSCASGHTFCMDLEFREGAPIPEMDEREDSACVMQVAFAYTAVVRDLEHEIRQRTLNGDDIRDVGDTHGGGRVRPCWVTVRRLRVTTVRAELCSQAGVVAFRADAAAMVTVLTHKVVAEARRSRFMEARALLRDWLSNFVYGLVQAFTLAAHENDLDEVDQGSPNLSTRGSSRESALSDPLVCKTTRLIYGLLHSPILDPNGVSADERVSLLHQMSYLDPESLSIALYPEMQGYGSSDVRMANNLSLSRRAITELYPICRIFVVDTLWRVVVHYEDTRAALEEHAMGNDVSPLAFPPPQESAIGDYLSMRQRFRPLAGREVVYSRPELPQVYFFEEALLEDKALPGGDDQQSFRTFFAELQREVTQE